MHFRQPDAIAILAVSLLVAAFKVESPVFPTICISLFAGIVIFAIVSHDELSWERRAAICALVGIADVAIVAYLYKVNLAKALKEQVVPLVAATLPKPVSSNCAIPKGAVGLYLGNTVSAITAFPHVVFKVHGEDVLVLDREGSGLVVSYIAFDDWDKVVGRLNKNVFTAINPASHVERPSASNLVVFDDRDTKVLDVQFLNPQAIKVTGVLRFPGKEPIVIGEKYVGVGGSISPPGCRTGEGAEFSVK